MFPTASSTIYRNEDGEVLGWSDESYAEPEYCDYCGGSHSSFFDCSADERDEDSADEYEYSGEAMDWDVLGESLGE